MLILATPGEENRSGHLGHGAERQTFYYVFWIWNHMNVSVLLKKSEVKILSDDLILAIMVEDLWKTS